MKAFAAGTLYEAFLDTSRRHAAGVALRRRGGVSMTWAEYAETVESNGWLLSRLGVGHGDTVAMLLDSAMDSYIWDMSALSLGAAAFSIYSSSSSSQIEHQLDVSGATVLLTTEEFADRVAAVDPARCRVEFIENLRPSDEDFVIEGTDAPRAEDVATLIFTSGTTGEPKAAELTHANIMAALRSSQEMVPLTQGCRLISYLPPAHIADRVLAYYYAMVTGATITFVDSPSQLVAELPDAQPHILLCVPRTWEVLRRAALTAAQTIGLTTFDADLGSAVELVRLGQSGEVLTADQQRRLDDLRERMRPVRERLGIDHVAFALSGSAPIGIEVLEFFAGLGVFICEGYGLSETTGISVLNRADRPRLGTIGLPAPAMECRLADDGELLIRGPLVMRGYRGNASATDAAIDDDGWFRSGDLATIDADGYIRIVGRKKEILITSSGKNVSPALVERAVAPESDLIDNIVCVGDGRPYLTALVTLDHNAVLRRFGLTDATGREQAAALPDVVDAISAAIGRGNAKLSRPEQIRDFRVVTDEWNPGSPVMTTTLKLRRAQIAERYAPLIDDMYVDRASATSRESHT